MLRLCRQSKLGRIVPQTPEHNPDIFLVAHQLEAVDVRHFAFGSDDVSGLAKVAAEVGVSSSDDRSNQAAIVLIIEESDHLHRDGAGVFACDGHSPAVRRANEDIRLIDDQWLIALVHRDALRREAELFDEPVSISRR